MVKSKTEPEHSITYKMVCAPREDSDQSAHPNLRCPPKHGLDFWLPTNCPAKSLIRLHECVDLSESSLGTHATYNVVEMLCPGSS